MDKQSALLNYLILNEIETAILTETWLDSSTMSDNFKLFGQYELVRELTNSRVNMGDLLFYVRLQMT